MRTRRIGDVEVGAIGLGGAPMSFVEPVDDERSIRTIHAALDAGVRLIDTAHVYTTLDHESHNEWIIARALASWSGDSSEVLVGTKGGHYRAGPTDFPRDARPEAIKSHCAISLKTLGVDCIGLYQLHWPDPNVPIAESMGAFRDLRDEGKIRMAGVSNFSIEQIEDARSVVEVHSVQNSFAPARTGDRAVLDYCASNGIAYLPYSPLGGPGGAGKIGQALPILAETAKRYGASPQQVALAWLLAQAPVVIPIPGATRAESIVDSAKAADLDLTSEDLAALTAVVG